MIGDLDLSGLYGARCAILGIQPRAPSCLLKQASIKMTPIHFLSGYYSENTYAL